MYKLGNIDIEAAILARLSRSWCRHKRAIGTKPEFWHNCDIWPHGVMSSRWSTNIQLMQLDIPYNADVVDRLLSLADNDL